MDLKNFSPQMKLKLDEAAKFVKPLMVGAPKIAITLGSGLSSFAKNLRDSKSIPFSEIPHFSPPTVEGHGGNLVFGRLNGIDLIVLQGRIHFYEGHDWSHVVFPTRLMAHLGIKTLILTNAAGGLEPGMRPGDFMVIKDHINLTGGNPLRGPNLDFLGPRFPDMSDLYDLSLREVLKNTLSSARVRHTEGVYVGVSGPSYETAAEVRFLRMIGAQAVGMSTVAETIAARHAGLRVAGISCITNLATGLTREKISHDEVKDIANRVEQQFASALTEFINKI